MRVIPWRGTTAKVMALVAIWAAAWAVAAPAQPRVAEALPVASVSYPHAKGLVLEVAVDTLPILAGTVVFWGKDFSWGGNKVARNAPQADGAIPFTWDIERQGIRAAGQIMPMKDNKQEWRWQFTVDKDIAADGETAPMHGGLVFKLSLAAPARRGCKADPVLREDKKGWSWEALPGQTIALEFAQPLGALHFERDKKNEIRAMFFEAPVKAGTMEQRMTLTLPAGMEVANGAGEAPAPPNTSGWFRNVMDLSKPFVDVSFLNEKPAGKHGFLKTKGDQFAFEDGTPVRFWSTSVVASSIFPGARKNGEVNKAVVDAQAKRLAGLGINLVRLHHHDSNWVKPNLIAPGETTGQFDDVALDAYFYTVKALQDQGIYVWIDLMVGHNFRPGDNIPGWNEIKARDKKAKTEEAPATGFNYFNEGVEKIWRKRAKDLITRKNPYTGKTLAEDPAIAGFTIWNENSLTFPFGIIFSNLKEGTYHRTQFMKALEAFAAKTGLASKDLLITWQAGVSQLFLNDAQYAWCKRQIDLLHEIGVKVPICAGHVWGKGSNLYCLPALTAGDVSDVHNYAKGEFIRKNPHFNDDAAGRIAMSQLADRPLLITEFNMNDKPLDQFTTLPYLATLAAFQGWDAPFFYAYSQDGYDASVKGKYNLSPWSSYGDPTLIGASPLAALIFRQGHVSEAKTTVAFKLSREQTYLQPGNETNRVALRTVPEQHKQVICLPKVKELDWSADTPVPPGAQVETDLDKDFLTLGNNEIVADTSEFRRDWVKGLFQVNTPKSQLVMGALGNGKLSTADVEFAIQSPQALVGLSSLDSKPLKESRRILLTTLGRMAQEKKGGDLLTEPVAGKMTLRSSIAGLRLIPLKSDGQEMESISLPSNGGAYTIEIPTTLKTHWFLIAGQ